MGRGETGWVVLTMCTHRKAVEPVFSLQAHTLVPGEAASVACQWRERLAACPASKRIPASILYRGRGFAIAEQAGRELEATLYVVSAGLGLVSATEAIPPYSLTVSPGSVDSVARVVTSRPFSPADWWDSLNETSARPRPIVKLARSQPKALLLLSISEPYTRLIQRDMLSLSEAQLSRVRLIGPRPSAALPPPLQSICMPYDERLDGPDSPLRGTRSDFAQRALAHFVENVLEKRPNGSADHHAHRVRSSLAQLRPPPTVARPRLNDQELLAWIRRHWAEEQGHSSRLLRRLRDVAGFACEQSRFAALCHQISQHLKA